MASEELGNDFWFYIEILVIIVIVIMQFKTFDNVKNMVQLHSKMEIGMIIKI